MSPYRVAMQARSDAVYRVLTLSAQLMVLAYSTAEGILWRKLGRP